MFSESPSAGEAARQLVVLLERLFSPCQCEVWLQEVRGLRCVHPYGSFSRFDWTAGQPLEDRDEREFLELRPGRYRVRLSSAGYLLAESPAWDPSLQRRFARCCQLAVGPLAALLEREQLMESRLALEARNRDLQTESAWLQSCFQLMQGGSDLLEPEVVLSRLTPLIESTFPGDGLVLGRLQAEDWKVRVLRGGAWPAEGNWRSLWDTCLRYGRVVHFSDVRTSRFAQAVPGAVGLTVAPLGFDLGVLCRSNSQASPGSEERLKHFEIAATLLGYLLKLGELEMQRAQAGKLAAIGQIAAGVAHEMNNPLAAIQLGLEMTAREKSLSNTTSVALKSALQALDRCRDVARELLSFSREAQHVHHLPVDLQEVARRALGISTEWARSRGLELKGEFCDHPLTVQANSGQLQEILLHLLDNALWAAEQGGKQVQLRLRGTSEAAEVMVQDNGPGVPEEVLEKIFEPFFTTRPMGEATGLGLAISRRLAQNLGGDVQLVKHQAGGAMFCLRIPLVPAGNPSLVT